MNCPANGNKCSICGQFNHFKDSEVCKKRRNIRAVDEDYGDETDDPSLDYLYLKTSFLRKRTKVIL